MYSVQLYGLCAANASNASPMMHDSVLLAQYRIAEYIINYISSSI